MSRDTVAVTYQGKRHLLNRHGSSAPVPFQYQFEEDGDLDLVIDGRSYEVDSPYDRDRSRKKKAVKKKPSKSAKNRR